MPFPLVAVLYANAALDFIVFALGASGIILPFGIPAALGGKPFFSEVLTPHVTALLESQAQPAARAFAVRTPVVQCVTAPSLPPRPF